MEPEFCVCVREENGRPRIVTPIIDPDYDRESYCWAITARLPYNSTDNGLPASGERPRVAEIERGLIAELTNSGYIYVGHVIADGFFLVVVYGKQAARASIKVKTGLHSETDIALESREDRSWSIFESELESTPAEQEAYRSKELYAVMESQGDVHSIERPVDFAFVFNRAEERDAFLSHAIENGFTPGVEPTHEDELGKFWCEIVRHTSIEPVQLGPIVSFLKKSVKNFGGTFDGWGTTIESAET